jgi:hypothetical protein
VLLRHLHAVGLPERARSALVTCLDSNLDVSWVKRVLPEARFNELNQLEIQPETLPEQGLKFLIHFDQVLFFSSDRPPAVPIELVETINGHAIEGEDLPDETVAELRRLGCLMVLVDGQGLFVVDL